MTNLPFFYLIFASTFLLNASLVSAQNDIQEVKIGAQTWMLRNLNNANFQNGESIPQAKNQKEWIEANMKKKPIWCYYDFNPEHGEKYGKLYNWFAVIDARGLAPEGWRIPNYKDWRALNAHLGNFMTNSERLKTKTGWAESPMSRGTNSSGFSALPAGYLACGLAIKQNFEFKFIKKMTQWWTIEAASDMPNGDPGAFLFGVSYSTSNTNLGKSSRSQYSGLSVRCIKKGK